MKRKLLRSIALLVSVLVAQVAFANLSVPASASTSASFMRQVCTSTLITAHRGLVGSYGGRYYSEDTIKSANGAYRYGADQSETDFRKSAEGTYFQLHDADLTRVTRGRDHRKLSQMTDAQIKAVILPGGSHIPTLQETLANMKYGPYKGRSGQLEIKAAKTSDDDLRGFVGLILKYGLQNQVMITSSKLGVLGRLHNLTKISESEYYAPGLVLAYVWYPNHSRPALSSLPSYVEGVNIDQSQATKRYVRAANHRGIKISARNAETSTQWQRLLHRGAATRPYNVLTDNMPKYRRWCNSR